VSLVLLCGVPCTHPYPLPPCPLSLPLLNPHVLPVQQSACGLNTMITGRKLSKWLSYLMYQRDMAMVLPSPFLPPLADIEHISGLLTVTFPFSTNLLAMP